MSFEFQVEGLDQEAEDVCNLFNGFAGWFPPAVTGLGLDADDQRIGLE